MKSKRVSPSLFACMTQLKDKQFHSGNALGESIGISRAAISKIMNILKSYQVNIEVNKSEGYRLREEFVLLDQAKIQKGLDHFIPIDIFEFVTSTNDYLLSSELPLSPRVCLAEYQTAGRGRFARSWQASFGKSILLSYLYPYYEDVSTLSGFSLMIAVSLVTALGHPELKIKWPNDLYFNNKKLGGILIELRAQSHGETKIVIGMGLNIETPEGPELTQVSSLSELGLNLDRNDYVILILNQLERDLKLFEQKGLPAFLTRFEQLDFLKNKEVTLTQYHTQHIQHTGIGMGIDSLGNLLLKNNQTGLIEKYSAGDTTFK